MWVKLAVFLSVLAALLLIIGTIIGYYLLKYVYKELRTDNFSDYSRETKVILEKYGDGVIKRAHVMRRSVPHQWLVGFYILHFFLSEKFRQNIFDTELFHQSLLLELETAHGPRMFIIEKTAELVVRDSVRITRHHTLELLKLSSDDISLFSLLESTKKAMGEELFFNWRTDSTCQHLVHTMVRQLDTTNTMTLPNECDGFPEEEAYIINKFMYYYYKIMRMLRLDKQILKYII